MSELDEAGYHAARKAMIDNGGGKSSPQALRNALCAYLDATAPSRAPDGGVTWSVQAGADAVEAWSKWMNDHNGAVSAACLVPAIKAYLARLAASRAGDRERVLEERWKQFAGDLYSRTNDDWVLEVHHVLTGPVCPTVTLHPEGGTIPFFRSDKESILEGIAEVLDLAEAWKRDHLAPAAGQDDAGECG